MARELRAEHQEKCVDLRIPMETSDLPAPNDMSALRTPSAKAATSRVLKSFACSERRAERQCSSRTQTHIRS